MGSLGYSVNLLAETLLALVSLGLSEIVCPREFRVEVGFHIYE